MIANSTRHVLTDNMSIKFSFYSCHLLHIQHDLLKLLSDLYQYCGCYCYSRLFSPQGSCYSVQVLMPRLEPNGSHFIIYPMSRQSVQRALQFFLRCVVLHPQYSLAPIEILCDKPTQKYEVAEKQYIVLNRVRLRLKFRPGARFGEAFYSKSQWTKVFTYF